MSLRSRARSLFKHDKQSEFEKVLTKIKYGKLELVKPEGKNTSFGKVRSGRGAKLFINDDSFYSSVLYDRKLNFGEAYVKGLWNSPDITSLLILFLDNYQIFRKEELALPKPVKMAKKIRKAIRNNEEQEPPVLPSELPRNFFAQILDRNLVYSTGLFLSPGDSLQKAQLNKIRRIIEKLQLSQKDHLLDIGCGWGAFTIEAARKCGCKVTAVTQSAEQAEYVKELANRYKLQKLISVELKDFHEIEGEYDKIVSMEMLEGTDSAHMRTFFEKINSLLCPHGITVIQLITMPNRKHDNHYEEHSFLRKLIFTGGELPSLKEICENIEAESDLFIHDLENIGVHYGRTMQLWHDNLRKNREKIEKLGFDETVYRQWSYYLSCMAALFETRNINDLQLVLTRPGNPNI